MPAQVLDLAGHKSAIRRRLGRVGQPVAGVIAARACCDGVRRSVGAAAALGDQVLSSASQFGQRRPIAATCRQLVRRQEPHTYATVVAAPALARESTLAMVLYSGVRWHEDSLMEIPRGLGNQSFGRRRITPSTSRPARRLRSRCSCMLWLVFGQREVWSNGRGGNVLRLLFPIKGLVVSFLDRRWRPSWRIRRPDW